MSIKCQKKSNFQKNENEINSLNLKSNSLLDAQSLYKILIKNPHLVNAIDDKKESILSYSIKNHNTSVSNLILTSPILNLNYEDKNGNSYLHLAILYKQEEIIKSLIEKGININKKNKEGNTALHFAYIKNDKQIINILEENGIDTNIVNIHNKLAEDMNINSKKNNNNNYNLRNNNKGINSYQHKKKQNSIHKQNNNNINFHMNHASHTITVFNNSYKKSKAIQPEPINNIKKQAPNCNERLELNEDDFNFDKNKNNIKNYNKKYPDNEKTIKSNYDLNKNDKNNINITYKKNEEEKEHYFINLEEKRNSINEDIKNNNCKNKIHKGFNSNNNNTNNTNSDSPKIPMKRISKVKKIIRNKNRNSHKNNFLFNSVGFINNNNNNYLFTSNENSTQNNERTTKIPINKKQGNKLEMSSSTKNIHKPNINNIIENNDNFKDLTEINKDDKKPNINLNSKNYIKKISTPKQSSKKNNSLNTNNNNNDHIENNLNINNTHLGSSLINQSLTKVNSHKKNTPLYEFLSEINLAKYFNNMDSNGFDDISILITEAKKDTLIKDEELKEVGISYPGDRAKILIRLKEKANLFGFSLPKGVYHTCKDLNKINEDKYISELNKWLKTLKVETYLMNFINSGYHSLDLLLLQMNTESPLTSEILRDEIGIDIIGYRSRILNKLKDDGKNLYNKLKTSTLIVNNKDNERKCDCFIL